MTLFLSLTIYACTETTTELSSETSTAPTTVITTNSTTLESTTQSSTTETTTVTTTETTTEITSETTTTSSIVYYENPVFTPVLADPSIIKDDDGYYYVFGTQDYGEWGDEFGTKYTPIIRSTNLVDWEFAGSAFTLQTRPIWGTANAGLWAPDIVKIGDTYNLYYSLSVWGDSNPGIGVATAPHPLGPWTDHGKLLDSNSVGVNNSIDPTVFVDEEDNVYIIWGSFRGIYGLELSKDGLSLQNEEYASDLKVRVAGYDTSTGWNASTYEGAYILQKDGYYYMFLSSGTCCEGLSSSYHVVVARSTSPLGPYYDDEGRDMLAGNRGYPVVNGSAYFVGTGHNSIVQDANGDYWILYHAYDTSVDPTFGNSPRRSLMIDKLIWNEDGWPSLNGTMPTNRETQGPIT